MSLAFITLGSTLELAIPITDASGSPVDPAASPTFRIYSGGLLVTNGTGSLSQTDTGTITNATNASPIVITSASHSLATGSRVQISGVLGNTAANGQFTVTKIDANTFSLDGSTGNGAYTSAGTYHLAGVYKFSKAITAGDGYVAGGVYRAMLSYVAGSTARLEQFEFMVQ